MKKSNILEAKYIKQECPKLFSYHCYLNFTKMFFLISRFLDKNQLVSFSHGNST